MIEVKAGDVGFADVSGWHDSYCVVRVVKPNSYGKMWKVEVFERDWENREMIFGKQVNRKVCVWHPLGDKEPQVALEILRAMRNELEVSIRAKRAEYHAAVAAYAKEPTA